MNDNYWIYSAGATTPPPEPRLSRSVCNNLLLLSLVRSVIEQMRLRQSEYDANLMELLDALDEAHTDYRNLVLHMARIQLNDKGEMMLPEKIYRRWKRKEQALYDAVLKTVPEKTLDARMWLTAVMLLVEDYAGMIQKTSSASSMWDDIGSRLTAIYRRYDPALRCVRLMRDGVSRGQQIMEVLA